MRIIQKIFVGIIVFLIISLIVLSLNRIVSESKVDTIQKINSINVDTFHFAKIVYDNYSYSLNKDNLFSKNDPNIWIYVELSNISEKRFGKDYFHNYSIYLSLTDNFSRTIYDFDRTLILNYKKSTLVSETNNKHAFTLSKDIFENGIYYGTIIVYDHLSGTESKMNNYFRLQDNDKLRASLRFCKTSDYCTGIDTFNHNDDIYLNLDIRGLYSKEKKINYHYYVDFYDSSNNYIDGINLDQNELKDVSENDIYYYISHWNKYTTTAKDIGLYKIKARVVDLNKGKSVNITKSFVIR